MSEYNARRSILSRARVSVGRNPNKQTVNDLYLQYFGDTDPQDLTDATITAVREKLTAIEPEPTAIEPEPTAIEPEPTAIKPEPTAIKPEPTAIEPESTATKPEPTAIDAWRPEPPNPSDLTFSAVKTLDPPVTLRTGLYKLGTGWDIPMLGLKHVHTHGSHVRVSYHGCEMTLADTFLIIGAISYVRLQYPETPEKSINDLNYPLEVIYS